MTTTAMMIEGNDYHNECDDADDDNNHYATASMYYSNIKSGSSAYIIV
jgi:hypothetical protein